MKRLFLFIIFLIVPVFSFSQELLAEVIVNYSKVQGSNNQVYTTLQKNLKDFINNTSWTGKNIPIQERIRCSFGIIIEDRPSTDQFKGSILIQSSRPVYNSTYITPVLNYQDNEFTFNYTEFETLTFNDSRFSGKNLIDVISFYVYMILGYDADTFANNGGTDYFLKAQKISDNAVNQNYKGWNSFDGPKTRGNLISNITDTKSKTLRTISYQYHRMGLDNMLVDELKSKTLIANNLLKLEQYTNNPQYYPLDIFLTAKRDEIASMFSGGQNTTVNISTLKSLLQTLSPINFDSYWSKIKN